MMAITQSMVESTHREYLDALRLLREAIAAGTSPANSQALAANVNTLWSAFVWMNAQVEADALRG